MKKSYASSIEINKVENGYLITIIIPPAPGELPSFVKDIMENIRKGFTEGPEPGEEWKQSIKSEESVLDNVNDILGEKKPVPGYREFIAKTWGEVLEIINANKI